MKEASQYCGLHPNTLRKYIDKGIIKGVRIGKHRYVDSSELNKLMGRIKQIPENTAIIYCRVSTRKQKDYLENQKKRLIEFCKQKGLEIVEIIEDIGSGVNEKRKGLKRLFKLVRNGKAKNVVVEYVDRLARFGVEYIKEFFEEHGVNLIVVEREDKSPEEELVEDLISIVVSFAGRIYGKRGAKNIIETIRREVKAYG